MKKRLHKIADDLQLICGFPNWEWLHIGAGVGDIETHLSNHAELERQYPEEEHDEQH